MRKTKQKCNVHSIINFNISLITVMQDLIEIASLPSSGKKLFNTLKKYQMLVRMTLLAHRH